VRWEITKVRYKISAYRNFCSVTLPLEVCLVIRHLQLSFNRTQPRGNKELLNVSSVHEILLAFYLSTRLGCLQEGRGSAQLCLESEANHYGRSNIFPRQRQFALPCS
jgi:hypothetical protein